MTPQRRLADLAALISGLATISLLATVIGIGLVEWIVP